MPISAPEIDDEGLARYPFLPQGRSFIREMLEENGITVEDLVEAPWLEDVRTREIEASYRCYSRRIR